LPNIVLPGMPDIIISICKSQIADSLAEYTCSHICAYARQCHISQMLVDKLREASITGRIVMEGSLT
jgi:hypothetical protein